MPGKKKTQILSELKQQCRELFHERCIVCGRHSRIVHEVIPRSSGKIAINLDNMVVLCNICHDHAHSVGSEISEETLLIYRNKGIARYGYKTK
ncbi:MAG: HNH endonuclease [Candidatus Dadabacteria bacterium]